MRLKLVLNESNLKHAHYNRPKSQSYFQAEVLHCWQPTRSDGRRLGHWRHHCRYRRFQLRWRLPNQTNVHGEMCWLRPTNLLDLKSRRPHCRGRKSAFPFRWLTQYLHRHHNPSLQMRLQPDFVVQGMSRRDLH